MSSTWDEAVLSALKNMITCCRDIQGFLVKDQMEFGQNNLAVIEESNRKKVELLEKLNFLIENISRHCFTHKQGNFIKKIEHDLIHQLDAEKQKELRLVVQELQFELNKCYNNIIKNIDLVFSNIKQFKEIWDKLLAGKLQMESTYDRMGKV